MTIDKNNRSEGLYVVCDHGNDQWHEDIWVGAEWRSKNNQNRPTANLYRWHTVRCNNSDCGYVAHIREDRLVRLVSDAAAYARRARA